MKTLITIAVAAILIACSGYTYTPTPPAAVAAQLSAESRVVTTAKKVHPTPRPGMDRMTFVEQVQ